jgi:hypothetical protein
VLWGGEGGGGRADFGNDLLRRINAQPRDFGETLHGRVMISEQIGHLLIELVEMVGDHAELFERVLHQLSVDRVQGRTGAQGIAQLLRRRAEARGGERGQRRGIGLAVSQRLQHAARADAQQIGDETRELDVRFFEQRFQAVLQLDAVERDLVLAPHHGPPEPLLDVGYKAQGQLLSDQPLHQSLRIGEISPAPTGPPVGLRLGEMQRARHPRGAHARPALRSPVLLQGFPHRSPVLRGRFHHDFLDLALDQPVGQLPQVAGAGPDLLAVEVVLAVDLDVGHDDRQHFLVDVNSRDPVRHRALLARAESVPRRISQGRELSPGLT